MLDFDKKLVDSKCDCQIAENRQIDYDWEKDSRYAIVLLVD